SLSSGSGSTSGSGSVAVALLENGPAARMVAVSSMLTDAPGARLASVHGSVVQAPVTESMRRFNGMSVTTTSRAADGPALATSMRYCTCWPTTNGPVLRNVLVMPTLAWIARVFSSTALLSPGLGSFTPSTVRVAVLASTAG